MIVLCAWCEQEGTEALIQDTASGDLGLASHGICERHEKGLLQKIYKIKNVDTIHVMRLFSAPFMQSGHRFLTVGACRGFKAHSKLNGGNRSSQTVPAEIKNFFMCVDG